ncbi:hypothetical protein VNI00_007186 [Paramarasmius palmivorus]|uniref:HMG domain-containing protein n=1 Tax=Paramarasmius palmivorus TaxID=297713 RepID=A0AAW0D2E5_9AGAR
MESLSETSRTGVGTEAGVSEESEDNITNTDAATEDSYEEYVHLVEEQYLVFVQVTTFHYAVQGFDVARKSGSGTFYHLEARKSGEESVRLSCLCPDGKKGDCFHKRFYREFRDIRFRMNEDTVKSEGAVVLFRRQMIGAREEMWLNRFSVAYGSHSDALRSRTIVTYEGPDIGGGKWTCAKCPSKRCSHARMARQLLNVIVGNIEDLDEAEGEESNIPLDQMFMVDSVNAGSINESAVSYLPILPPEWAALPEDPSLYPRVSPAAPLPWILALHQTARSACGKHFFNPTAAIVQRECTIYTLVGKVKCQICVQPCPGCPRYQKCFIGPDARTYGIFNFNNSVLFTHELLDEYTNRYTGSETPFASFVIALGRIYQGRGERFIGEDLFRSAWFAFASLQVMEGDMFCPTCGSTPDTVIFDGVTLAFAKRHLQDSLQPPTYIPPDGLQRRRVRVRDQQWISNAVQSREPGVKGHKEVGPRVLFAQWIKKWGDRKVIEGQERKQMGEELKALSKELIAVGAKPVASALSTVYNAEGELRPWSVRRRYRVLFEQLSANESVVQMMNELGLQALKRFAKLPSVANASLLVDVPAMMLVCEQEVRTKQCDPILLELCCWMIGRAEEVLSKLMRGDNPNLEGITNSKHSGDNWKEVSRWSSIQRRFH